MKPTNTSLIYASTIITISKTAIPKKSNKQQINQTNNKICKLYGFDNFSELKFDNFKPLSKNAKLDKFIQNPQNCPNDFLLSEDYLNLLKNNSLRKGLNPSESFKGADLAELHNKTPAVTITPFFGKISQNNEGKTFRPFVFDIEQSIFLQKSSQLQPASSNIYTLIQNLKEKIKNITEYVDNNFIQNIKRVIIPDNLIKLDAFFKMAEVDSLQKTNRFENQKYYLEQFVFNKYES